MRKLLVILLTIPIIAATIPEVKKVDVFPGGARVYMEGKIPQSGILEVGPLPRDIYELIVSVSDYEVKCKDNDSFPEEALKIKKKYETLNAEMKKLENKETILKNKYNFYQTAISNYAKRFAKGGVGNWEATLSSLSSRLSTILKEYTSLRETKEKLEKKLKEAEAEWNSIKGRIGKATYIKIKGTPEEKFLMEFNTRSLGWKVNYAFNSDLNAETLNIKSFVVLNSDLPFDIFSKIYLVPRKPSYYSSLPLQNRWSISIYEPRVYKYKKTTKAAAPMPVMAAMEGGVADKGEAMAVTKGFYRMVYLGTRKLSFGKNRFKLFARDLKSTITWQLFPALSKSVFVVAETKNTTGFHLVPAKALFFVNGIFTRKATLKETPEKAKMKLLLGNDPSFKVNYTRTVVERNEGIRKNGIVIERKVKITNGGNKERKVTVKLPLPYAVDEEIEIRDTIVPKPDTIDKNRIATWNITISPGATKTITLRFKIVYPKSKRITGIDTY